MHFSLLESGVFVELFIDYCRYARDVGGGSVNYSSERHIFVRKYTLSVALSEMALWFFWL